MLFEETPFVGYITDGALLSVMFVLSMYHTLPFAKKSLGMVFEVVGTGQGSCAY